MISAALLGAVAAGVPGCSVERTWDVLGLENGDRIVAVGEIPMRSPAATAEALQLLGANRTRLRALRVSEREVELFADVPR